MNLEPGDQIQLSDGHTYLFLFPFKLHNQNYMIFSCNEVEDAFRLGKYVKQNDQNSIVFVYDKKIIDEVHEYLSQHQELIPGATE